MYYLIKYNAACDYGFIINGIAVVSKELWISIIDEVSEIDYPFNFALGSNQKIYYEDGLDLIQDFDIEELSKAEAFIIIEKLIMNDVDYIDNLPKLFEDLFLVETGNFPDMFMLVSGEE